MRRLPGLARFQRPRGPAEVVVRTGSTTSAEYAATHRDARWTVVEPAATLERRPPIHLGSAPSLLDEHLVTSFPDLGVLTIPGGIVGGTSAWVFTPDGTLLRDQTWHGDDARHRKQFARRSTERFPVQRLSGTVISIATFEASTNYGHFLLDGVTRLRLLEDAGVSLRSADHVLYNAPHVKARRILERLGVPMDRAIPVSDDRAYQADRLIAPGFPGVRRNYQHWVPRWLRARLAPLDVPRTRRLYVPRLAERRLANIDEIAPILEEHGFETFEPTAHRDPLEAFASAQVVVGAHGSGLTDIVACRPGTAVLELLPSLHQMPYFYTLADGAGLTYADLVGPSHRELAPPGTYKRYLPFSVDPGEFRDALGAVIALAPPVETLPGA